MLPVARKHIAITTRVLPRWLRALDQDLRPLDWYVKSGWGALHMAALRGGNSAGLRSRYSVDPDSLKVHIGQYRSLVLDIPRRLGVMDEDLGRRWIQMAAQIGDTLAAKVWHENSKPEDRSNVIVKEFLYGTRHGLLRTFPSIEFSVATPFDALRSAYRALRQGRSAKNVRTIELYCLAWIGIAAHAILKMRHCDLCFRWAIPGHDHCYEHSQSKEAPGTPQEKSLRYRNAAKIAVTFRYPPRPAPRHSTMSVRRLPQLMARLIWHTPLPDEERTLRAIEQVLAKRPTVLAQMGPDALLLKSLAFYKRLEERIDPLEINPSSWVWKIKQFDRWEREKISRCPGGRGYGRRTRWRIIKAISLAEKGVSKSMIARILDVHPSSISNWIRRESFPGLANMLKQKKKRAKKSEVV